MNKYILFLVLCFATTVAKGCETDKDVGKCIEKNVRRNIGNLVANPQNSKLTKKFAYEEISKEEIIEEYYKNYRNRKISFAIGGAVLMYLGCEGWLAYKQLSEQERSQMSAMLRTIASRAWSNIKRRPREVVTYAKNLIWKKNE
jgi:hypothetical protein